ncbi:hypothetical protein [Thiohalobacter thiocyanaticus]|uniref:Regulatory protein, RpfE type n=1 Tax=Thiohalobacter thiocyanaticus TaxID=585455 RepID=A0A426QE58_9GAMM|nr:hypothetical protein [Thiohalobacter thiocyanaticus]RRQ20021.1 hypothetical protein D6C00_14780 [Thiohalobacter thiocyanaticus]
MPSSRGWKTIELSLCVPGLLGPLPGVDPTDLDLPALPALCRLLARADRGRGPRELFEALADLGGYPRAALPAARLRYLAETGGMGGPGDLLCADPVHLRADQDRVLLFDADLNVTAGEAHALCEAFNAFEADSGMRLECVTPEHWYLHVPGGIDIETTPLQHARGRDIDPLLPRGPGRVRWHALLNEWQMLLFQQPANQQRQQAGRPMINGVWLWGEGELVDGHTEVKTLWADDPLVQGMGRHLSVNSRQLPADPAHWLASVGPGHHWIHLPGLLLPLAYLDLEHWRQSVMELETAWFQPLFAAVNSGRVNRVNLLPCNGSVFHYRRRYRWRFWRRARPLTTYMQS